LKEVEQSLKRLQTDYIDLYQSHIDDEATPSWRKTLETLCATGEAGEGARDRRIQLRRRTAPRRRWRSAPSTVTQLSELAAALQSLRTERLRSQARTGVERRGSA
jgi:hypothetical protein